MRRQGEAGFDQPQDCKVTVDIKKEGGIEILLNSKMERMFGKAIRNSVMEEMEALNVKNACVKVDDYGSLDFVIRARAKTAVTRAKEK